MQNEEHSFDQWNLLKKDTDANETNTKIRTGEVRWCRYGINIGKEIIGKGDTFRRPVLIVKKFSGDVFLGLPLTTKVKEGDWYHPLVTNGIQRSVILNQSRVLDRKRLEDKLFELSATELDQVKRAYCKLILTP